MPDKPLILFGASTFASLAAHCITHDTDRTVAAFAADAQFIKTSTHEGLPVVAFEHLPRHFGPEDYDVLIPAGYVRMNALRRERYEQAKAMGYRVASYVSTRASVWPDMPIGENVFIYEHSILQSHVRLGLNVTVRAGANIGHHGVIGNHSFIASGVVSGGNIRIGESCFVGLGAILRDGITIGDRCFVGAGAVVLSDTEPNGVYFGNPARRLRKGSPEERRSGI